MPRKPNPPPPVLRIENLSTGIDTDMRDDFTGEVMPQLQAKPRQSAQELLGAINVAKHSQNQLLLQAAGIVPKPHIPACVRPIAPHEPAGPRRDGQKSKPITLVRLKASWRRV